MHQKFLYERIYLPLCLFIALPLCYQDPCAFIKLPLPVCTLVIGSAQLYLPAVFTETVSIHV